MRAFDLPPSLASGDAPGGTPFFEPTHPLGNWELRNGVRSSYCPGIKRTHPPGRTLPGGVQACGNGFPPGSTLPGGCAGLRRPAANQGAALWYRAAPWLVGAPCRQPGRSPVVQGCAALVGYMPTLMASVENWRAGIRMIIVGCHLSRNPPGG